MIGWIIIIVVLLVMFLIPVGIAAWILSVYYNKQEKLLRDEAEAHRKILDGTYDRIWNNIKQRTGISEEFRRSFNDIYPDLIDQSINNEAFVDWIPDCNPDFDPNEYVPLLEHRPRPREIHHPPTPHARAHQRSPPAGLRQARPMAHPRLLGHPVCAHGHRFCPLGTTYLTDSKPFL